jgi:dienelactone hydrolase
MRHARLLVAVALGCAPFFACPVTLPAWAAAGKTVTIPVRESSGEVARMVTTWFLPPGEGPFPVVLFSHGRAGPDGRARLEVGVSKAQLQYWLAKGVAVVSPVRPGYGESTGGDVEQGGARFDSRGQCVSKPNFHQTADAAVLSVGATLLWLREQPWADANDVLLVGQSVGGLATVAAGARGFAGVVGYVNFAGGSGGDPERAPGASCDPDQLKDMFATYGRTTRVPNLWVYALNDQYWGPAVPATWHAAFARGGSASTFVHTAVVADGDGHGLSRHEQALWAPAVDAFIAGIGFPGKAGVARRASPVEH